MRPIARRWRWRSNSPTTALTCQRCSRFRGDPPFEDGFKDYGIYLRALIGEGIDDAVAHFRGKIASCNPETAGPVPAQTLVALLARLGRYDEAIAVSLEHLRDVDPNSTLLPICIPVMPGGWRLQPAAQPGAGARRFAAFRRRSA